MCERARYLADAPIPRLAGQLYPYTIKALTNWGRERGEAANSRVMQPIAHTLSRSEMEAVAAYFSTLD